MSPRDAFDHYLGELQGLPLLDAAQELKLGQELERLEQERWGALLSSVRALECVAAAIAPLLPARAGKLDALLGRARSRRRKSKPAAKRDAGWTRALAAAATELWTLDRERSGVDAAELAVCQAFAADARTRAYLGRVQSARQAALRMKNHFVAANLRLVIAMARRYDTSLLSLADLVQEGNLGLIRAVERFDYRRGLRFSTYASWWIRHSFNRALSDKARLVRVPVHALDDLARIRRISQRIATKTGAAPSASELAEQLGMPEAKLALLNTAPLTKHPLSLDRSLSDEREQTLHDLLPSPEEADPEAALDLATQREGLDQLLAGLPSIEASVLRFRFGLGDGEELTLQEIGAKYNLSRERIRQLQQQALGRLREAVRDRDARNPRPAGDSRAA